MFQIVLQKFPTFLLSFVLEIIFQKLKRFQNSFYSSDYVVLGDVFSNIKKLFLYAYLFHQSKIINFELWLNLRFPRLKNASPNIRN